MKLNAPVNPSLVSYLHLQENLGVMRGPLKIYALTLLSTQPNAGSKADASLRRKADVTK